MRDARNALLVALLIALSVPRVAAAGTPTTEELRSASPDRSVVARFLAGGILIVVTGLAAWLGKRRVALTKRTIAIDLPAGTTLSKDEWERIPQQQRTA